MIIQLEVSNLIVTSDLTLMYGTANQGISTAPVAANISIEVKDILLYDQCKCNKAMDYKPSHVMNEYITAIPSEANFLVYDIQ